MPAPRRERSLIEKNAASMFVAGNMKILQATLLVVLVLLLPERAQSQVVDPLKYSGGFLVTGDYVVSGVDLNNNQNPPKGGFSERTINIQGCTNVI